MTSLKALFDIDEDRLYTVATYNSYKEYLEWAIHRLEEVIEKMVRGKEFWGNASQDMYKYRSNALEFFRKNLKEIEDAT